MAVFTITWEATRTVERDFGDWGIEQVIEWAYDEVPNFDRAETSSYVVPSKTQTK